MTHIRRTMTHPYGYAAVGNAELAFIRISKNASTYIAQTLNLTRWERIDHLPSHRFICALRDPADRFFSGVAETIGRIGVFFDKSDVPVDLRILKEVTATCMAYDGDIADFLERYIGIIESYGFFDAHHEPQHYFLIDALEAGVAVEYFDVSKADSVVSRLAESYKLSTGRRNSSRQKLSQSRFQTAPRLQRIVKDLQKFRHSEAELGFRPPIHALCREDYKLRQRVLAQSVL